MRSKVVVGNWKLNGSQASNEALLKALLREIPRDNPVACAVCVPSPYLAQARALLEGSGIAWGAQDLSRYDRGAYTGEVSGAMLAEFGCRYVIVGHSERRDALRRDRRDRGREVRRGAQRRPHADLLRGRDARGTRGRPDAGGARAAGGCAPRALRRGGAGPGTGRVRAGVGHRHGQDGDRGPGGRGAGLHPRAHRREGRGCRAQGCRSCTAAA